MTSVSASSAGPQTISQPRAEKAGAHKQRLLDQISAQQQAGSLSDTDASALASAVQDIDPAMSGTSGTRGGTRLDPAQARSRMDDLIGAEVTKGALTGDQATTLKSLLSSQKGGGRDGAGGGVGGAGNPPPGPPPSGGTGAASATTDASDLLTSFLKQLQDSQAQNQASGYGAGGSGSTPKGGQAAVFDFSV